jgi:hypothetical protein
MLVSFRLSQFIGASFGTKGTKIIAKRRKTPITKFALRFI